MSFYYPQAAMTLRVLWEDFKLVSDASLQKVYTFPVIAKRLTLNLNDYQTSDTFDCEIDYKHFPFDPRCIRSCGVTIHLQDMGTLINKDGSQSKITPSQKNTRFQGFVDEETLTFDDDKRTVRFEGRDFTSLLIDQKYLQNSPIALNQPLDVIITNLLGNFKSTAQLKVVNLTQKELPTLAEFYPDFGSPLSGMKNTGSHETYWEIIQDMVARCGLICYMHLDTLFISTPRLLYNANNAVKFIYGWNIKNLTYKRKLGRHKGFNVLVRALVGKTVLSAKIPEEATNDWLKAVQLTNQPITVPVLKPDGTVDSSQAGHTAPYMSFRLKNIANKDQLVKIGEKIFEDISRQQIEGSFETHEMVGHSGNPGESNYQEFDLTDLKIGQPIRIEIDTGDLEGIKRLNSENARTQFLIAKAYDPTIARAFARSMGKFTPVFYTKSYSITFDDDNGYKQKVEFLNFIDLSNRGLA